MNYSDKDEYYRDQSSFRQFLKIWFLKITHKQIISPTSGAGTAYPSGAPEFTSPLGF
jgi:hypothetical protein